MCIRDSQRIVEYAVAEFKKSDRIDLSRDPAAMGRLKEEAEKAKKELSSALSAQLTGNVPAEKAGDAVRFDHVSLTYKGAGAPSLSEDVYKRQRYTSPVKRPQEHPLKSK